MSIGGWIFMGLTWGVILTLLIFSYTKTIRSKDKGGSSYEDAN